jgi:hypothetical protein
MKKSTVFLFLLRLFFYFSVITLIFIHPGITVSFDRIGIIQWFVIIPIMAITAFQSAFASRPHKRFLFALVLLLPLSVIAGGFGLSAFAPFIAGFLSFFLTLLLFNHHLTNLKWAKITFLEPFFLAWVCLRLLSLSRSGEEIAGQSIALTQFILVWTVVVFLFHSAIIYLCFYHKSRVKIWKEGLISVFGAATALIVLLVVLPPDFVRNTIIENLVTNRVPERIRPSETDRGLPLRGSGHRTLPRGEQRANDLRGIPEHDWPGRSGGADDNRQYMVKIVASEREPVYMGNTFRGRLDPVHGFIINPEEPLNDLTSQRLFVTWFDNQRSFDFGRERQEIFSLSTLQQKYLPYRPLVVDPIILNDNSGPLRYIHQVVSNMHFGDPLLLVNIPTRNFTERERLVLAPYLEVSLTENDRIEFETFLNNILREWRNNRERIINSDHYLRAVFSIQDHQSDVTYNHYMETIIALLTSFSSYQYDIKMDNNSSIVALKEFLFITREGDCVEFSNVLALLGRLAGIPSRVVTGYLAAEQLQTPAHLRGLSALRTRIPALQQFPFDNLFMVTNLHSHSWTQFYIPDYGWLDFEATSFSIPPVGMGDFNNWDVVIPLFSETRTFSQVRQFPWQAVIRVLIFLIIVALILAYSLRYGRELVLFINSQNNSNCRTRARSLYLLLLARLAADGQPIKPASKTAHEYSQLFLNSIIQKRRDAEGIKEEDTRFKTFADIYSAIRWREFSNETEVNEHFLRLKEEYFNILKNTRRSGIHRWFIRIFSLRGLAYL